MLSNERAWFKKTIQSLQAKSSVARGPLTWRELIWSSRQSGGGSPESRFPTSPLLALPAKEILCSVTNGRGALGRRQCGGGPLHLPPSHDPERCRRVLPDNHNCVLEPLIKFRSLEWYCFAMNPYEKCTALGDYGSCGGAEGGSSKVEAEMTFISIFLYASKASMDAEWIPAITLLLSLHPLLLHPSVTLPLCLTDSHRHKHCPSFVHRLTKAIMLRKRCRSFDCQSKVWNVLW